MKAEEIFREIYGRRKRESYFFGRKLVILDIGAFRDYEKEFKISLNFFNKRKNYRTKEWFKHLHALKTGKEIEFHFDYGNPSTLPVIGHLIHTFFDVIPYFIWHLIKLKKPYSIK